jgi:iron complex outermembrane receptor protein
MNKKLMPLLISSIFFSSPVLAQSVTETFMGEVNVKGRRTNQILPEFPSTTATIDAKEIEDTVNAIDTPDVLKYLPDIMVRKRDSADFNGAPIGSRIWGISYSAKSIVNIDGMPISNQLFNDNTYGSPRWWMTNPEEIKNVEVMYGPYSAVYSGNSEGAVVNIATVMPTKFTAVVNQTGSLQQFKLFGTDSNYANSGTSAILGDKQGDFAWRLSLNHEDAHSQPRGYARSTTAPNVGGTPTGYQYQANTGGTVGTYLGATNLVHGISDNANLKMSYDLNPDIRATLTSGVWTGQTDAGVQAFSGATAASPANFNSVTTASAFTQYQQNYMNGVSLKTVGDQDFTWEANVSNFYTDQNAQRWSNSLNADGSMQPNGAGQLADYRGTGWTNADLRGNYKIGGDQGSHKLSFGAHYDYNRLNYQQSSFTANQGWQTASSGTPYSISKGVTQTQALWVQDLWKLHEDLRMTMGLRYENWSSFNGQVANTNSSNALIVSNFNKIAYNGKVSPKVSLAWDGPGDVLIIGSLAKATRFPTVSELYSSDKCSTTVGGCQTSGQSANYYTPDPSTKKPEDVTSAELSFERSGAAGNARFTLFTEQVKNALLKQLVALNSAYPTNYYNVWSNVEKVTASGVELAGQANNVIVRGLDVGGNITRVVSRIAEDSGLGTSGQSLVGNTIPYTPPLRFTALATYRPDQQLAYTLAGRFQKAGQPSIDNNQVNPNTYGGFSTFFVLDAKVRYQIDKSWLASAGIDNILNREYWMFHPFPQRTFIATLKYSHN